MKIGRTSHDTRRKKANQEVSHILAAMIDTSIGYFTPLMALRALLSYKNKEPFYCEWYTHMAHKVLEVGELSKNPML